MNLIAAYIKSDAASKARIHNQLIKLGIKPMDYQVEMLSRFEQQPSRNFRSYRQMGTLEPSRRFMQACDMFFDTSRRELFVNTQNTLEVIAKLP